MTILTQEEMKEFNQALFETIIQKFKKKHIHTKVGKIDDLSFLCISVDGSNAALQIAVDKSILVVTNVNTKNCEDWRNTYWYFDFADYADDDGFIRIDLTKYRHRTEALFMYLLSETIIMPYNAKFRHELQPSNMTIDEKNRSTRETRWEQRFLDSHFYSDTKGLDEWLDRCTGAISDVERCLVCSK